MRNTMIGADLGDLVDLAELFTMSADRLRQRQEMLASSVRSLSWSGADSLRLTSEWPAQNQALTDAAQLLLDAASSIRRNRGEQEDASRGGVTAIGIAVPSARIQHPLTSAQRSSVVAGFAEFVWTGNNMPSPEEIARKWASMTPEEQAAITELRPDLLRNLDGIPYRLRGELCFDYLNEQIASRGCSVSDASDPTCDDLLLLQSKLFTGDVPPKRIEGRNVMLLDLDSYPGDVMAAVSEGDVDNADYVMVRANGLNSTVAGMGGDIDYQHDNRAKYQVYDQLNGMGGKEYAVISYHAYRTPQLDAVNDISNSGVLAKASVVMNPVTYIKGAYQLLDPETSVAQGHLAAEGAPGFARLLGGVEAVNPGVESTANIYSYGSVMGADALRLLPPGTVDHVVAVESPGMGDVSAIQTGDGRGVQVVEVHNDPVADAGRLLGRSDPNRVLPEQNVLATDPRAPSLETNNQATIDEGGHGGGNAKGSTAQWDQIWVSIGKHPDAAASRGDDWLDIGADALSTTPFGPLLN